ncbi:MAG: hypothetical protein JKY65_27125 [Planctomycetes bacterium]|nr:hypothetical protein [Planctomycetota bacterium]
MSEPEPPDEPEVDKPEVDEPEVDVSDLKTYDVPDPPQLATTWLRMFVGVPLGLFLALGLLRATAATHYFAVASNSAESTKNKTSARRFINELPPEEVKERVLAIEDPAARGGFHKVLAETKDPAQAPAVLAYIKAYQGYNSEEIKGAMASLRAFPSEDVAPGLIELREKSVGNLLGLSNLGDMIKAELEQHHKPAACLDAVLAIEDPKRRGSYYWVLPASEDPEQIDAILAYVESRGKQSGANPFKGEAAALIAFGAAATPKLKEGLHSKKRPIINLSAEALSKVNLGFLTKYCREELTTYGKGVPGKQGLAWASWVVSSLERKGGLAGAGIKQSDLPSARKIVSEAAQHSLRIMEMLLAMEKIRSNKEIDYCFIHGLSCYSQQVAQYCAKTLQSRLKTDELIDVLFSFIAQKDSFTTTEVNVYESMLLRTGSPGAARVAFNLERLLKEAKGKTEEVFFLYKKMGFAVLHKNGQMAQLKTLERFANDTDSYLKTGTRNGQRTETEVKFKNEVRAAVSAIKGRGL